MTAVADKSYESWRKRIYTKSELHLGLGQKNVKKLLSDTSAMIAAHVMTEDGFDHQQQRWLRDKLVWEQLFTLHDNRDVFPGNRPALPPRKFPANPGYLPNCRTCFDKTGCGQSLSCPLIDHRACQSNNYHPMYMVRYGHESFHELECPECSREQIRATNAENERVKIEADIQYTEKTKKIVAARLAANARRELNEKKAKEAREALKAKEEEEEEGEWEKVKMTVEVEEESWEFL